MFCGSNEKRDHHVLGLHYVCLIKNLSCRICNSIVTYLDDKKREREMCVCLMANSKVTLVSSMFEW